MYHKSNLNIMRRGDLEHEHIESIWFELKTKVHPILININYRSELQSHTFYWQFFYLMLKQALDENSHIIYLGDLNKNFMVNLPTTVNDIVVVNGLVKGAFFSNQSLANVVCSLLNVVCRLLNAAKVETNT